MLTSVTEVKEKALGMAHRDFQKAGLLDKSPQRDAARALTKALLSSPSHKISFNQLNQLIPDPDTKQVLLAKQIIAYHTSNFSITFQSRFLQQYAQQMLK